MFNIYHFVISNVNHMAESPRRAKLDNQCSMVQWTFPKFYSELVPKKASMFRILLIYCFSSLVKFVKKNFFNEYRMELGSNSDLEL